jgi:O-antigen ligase
MWLFFAHRRLLVPVAAAAVVLGIAAYSASLLPKVLSKRIDDTLTPGQSLYARGGVAGQFDSSVNIRISIHAMTAEIFSESPIYGHGFASFQRLAAEKGGKYGLWGLNRVGSESVLINTAVESGLIGLLIYGWLSWMLISPALALMRTPDQHLAVAFIAISAAIFVESLTQIALFLPEISLPFWWMSGMVCRAYEDASRSRAA